MDGVRLTQPTILLSGDKGGPRPSYESSHLPLGIVLAVAGSGGKRLACAVGAGLEELDLGIGLADLLLPKPALCGRTLDLTIGDHRLIGHPLPIDRPLACGASAGSELRALNVAFVLDALAPAESAGKYSRSITVCELLAAELGQALAHHEAQNGLVSGCGSASSTNGAGLPIAAGLASASSAAIPAASAPATGAGPAIAAAPACRCDPHAEVRRDSTHVERDGASGASCRGDASGRGSTDGGPAGGCSGWLAPGSTSGSPTSLSHPLSVPLSAALQAVKLTVDGAHTLLRVPLASHLFVEVQLPPPPTRQSHLSPCRLARVPGGMPPPPTLRPYLGLLPLRDDTLSAIPPDGSKLLERLVREASPLRSFSELQLETGLPMPTLFKLTLHLEWWGHVRVVTPITEDSLFCIHPAASVAPGSDAARAYDTAFGAKPALPFATALQLFSTPRRFGALLRSQSVPARRLVQATVFLWRWRVIQQLTLTILCVEEPPEPVTSMPQPRSGSSRGDEVVGAGRGDGRMSAAMARWLLFRQLRPMLNGEHSVEEMAWHEGVPRKAIEEMVGAYPEQLVTLAMPAEGEE
jgi:hypothetical protein